jgi:hypothetical protein
MYYKSPTNTLYWYDFGVPLSGLPEGSVAITLEEAKRVNGGPFHGEQPFPSWVLHESESYWMAPTPYPTDGNMYEWDEDSLSWRMIT